MNVLKGACIIGQSGGPTSVINASAYGVIRTALMRKRADGVRVYVDRWPAWLDLENLMRGVGRGLLAVSAVLCRALDRILDGSVVFARKTTHRQLKEDKIQVSRNRLAYWTGCFLEWNSDLLNKTVRRKRPVEKAYVRRLMEFEEKTVRTNRIINESLSFALLLVCIGLIVVLLYLLWIR